MNADDCNGRSYTQGNGGETSMEQDFYGPVQGPARSPNSQQSSPRRSLSANSIKVELCSEDESPGAQQPESREAVKEDSRKDGGGDPMEEGNTQFTGAPRDRVTIYSEMASPNAASPGPIRLPNGKLQCEVCGIECVGPNVLMVHKRSHTGERPFHCNQCGASFTQKGNLLRHIKLHSGEKPFKCPSCNYACRRRDALAGHLRTHAGEKHMHLNPPEAPYELSSGSEKDGDLMSSQPTGDSAGLPSSRLQGTKGKGENHKSPLLSQLSPAFLSDIRMAMSSIGSNVTPQGPRAHGGGGLATMSHGLAGREAGEGRVDQPSAHSHTTSPNGCPDSTDTESTAEEQSTRATAPTSTSNNHHLHYQTPALPRSLPTSSPSQAKYLEPDWERACVVPAPPVKKILSSPLSSRETVQVLDRNGRPVRSFPCHHCSILFLDHVMFTIHMGCHGFRQPFECNICGHLSQDRYEFSSHISRGEHQVG
uniref:IKAROS family zinc finger 4 n=1 Tax=Cynoglossus semilaevis TaxID=244447 RepID=A0A3P8VD53_CYNSE